MFESYFAALRLFIEQLLYGGNFINSIRLLIPYLLFIEVPLFVFILVGLVRHSVEQSRQPEAVGYQPNVSCILTCYREGREIESSIASILEQTYGGLIQIIVVVDGAHENRETLQAAYALQKRLGAYPKRKLTVLPKWPRGGLVSSINAGLPFVEGEIVIRLDGDSSLANDAVARVVQRFSDPEIVAATGSIRVRNRDATLWTKLQTIEYWLSITVSKTAFDSFGMIGCISGAFGIFRKDLIDKLGGWDAGSAEDLDMTLRIKAYYRRTQGKMRIAFVQDAVCYTNVPETLLKYYKQRQRWDGDYPYILKKHHQSLSPRIIGWRAFVLEVFNIFMLPISSVLIYCYTVYMLLCYPLSHYFALMTILYAVYLLISAITYFCSILLLSPQPKNELELAPLLILYIPFLFFARINSFLAIVWELVDQQHKSSSIVPYYVSRKNKQ